MTNDESRLRLADYLSHMLEAAPLARECVEDVVKADFLNDRRTQQAVVLNLITIGEAASRIVSDYGDFARTPAPATGFTTHVLATALLTASRAHYGSYRAIGC